MSNTLLRVAIVGGGASGVAVASHLAKSVDPATDLRVTIFEPGEGLGRGIAYSTTDAQHLLNVPGKGMSLYRDDMAHFQRWAGADADDFVSRVRYGDYLQSSLLDAWRYRHGRLLHIRAAVVDVQSAVGRRWVVIDGRGRTHECDAVILATGHQAPVLPAGVAPSAVEHVHPDPWAAEALGGLRPGEHVVCLGSGLTFIDVALSALAVPGVTVTGISRSGRLPARHVRPLPTPVPPTVVPATLDQTVEHIRAAGSDWRGALDGLRAHTSTMWAQAAADERARFMRDWAREWDIHRHRMAPEVSDVIFTHRRAGRLQVLAMPDYAVASDGRGLAVIDDSRVMRADRVVVCTGPRADVRLTPLGASLVRRGVARPGPFDIGYDVMATTGEVVGRAGVADNLFTIGPLRRGVLFESTAMPEISAQAQALAGLIAARCSALITV